MGKNNRHNHQYHNRDNRSTEADGYNEESDKKPELQNEEDMEVMDVPETETPGEEMEASTAPDPEVNVAELEEQLAKEKKEYLFLMAEFDNFRKRTLREKSEIIRNGAEQTLKGLLPIVDDFERAIKATENSDDATAIKEGTRLIYNKLKKYLEQNGVKEMDPADNTFDTERHEAISVIPAPEPSLKGKILDTVEKGYMLNDKVLRHAKVVVAQ